MRLIDLRFPLAWSLPVLVAAAAWRSPVLAWVATLSFQLALAAIERFPPALHSPAAERAPAPRFRWFVRLHLPLQAALLALGVFVAVRHDAAGGSWWAVVALGIGVGGVTGGQGITFAHELGHSRPRLDRVLSWMLMSSVLYAHFLVEHYRGHHPRAATWDDPASAREGETLWRFLPRTLAGSFANAWRLEAQQLRRLRRGWPRSPLLWATLLQLVGLVLLASTFGAAALLFWLVQAAYAVFLLEAINYIEHYGLARRKDTQGRPEPFGMQHAWNADHALTNIFVANLQRHSDHHLHAWKPYETLDALPGPQLPTGYAGCIFLATVPPLWFRAMRPRLTAWSTA